MVRGSFTWVVRMGASGFALATEQRRRYWGDLRRICLLGSVAVMPAAPVSSCDELWWNGPTAKGSRWYSWTGPVPSVTRESHRSPFASWRRLCSSYTVATQPPVYRKFQFPACPVRQYIWEMPRATCMSRPLS